MASPISAPHAPSYPLPAAEFAYVALKESPDLRGERRFGSLEEALRRMLRKADAVAGDVDAVLVQVNDTLSEGLAICNTRGEIEFVNAKLCSMLERSAAELEVAGKKTIEIMRASPYQKTANAGLFLKALGSRNNVLPRLLAANLGNQLSNAEALARLAEFTSPAPRLEESQLDQIAALPLGSRIKLDPWRDQSTLVKTRPLELLAPREKMPFEITPFILYLTRLP